MSSDELLERRNTAEVWPAQAEILRLLTGPLGHSAITRCIMILASVLIAAGTSVKAAAPVPAAQPSSAHAPKQKITFENAILPLLSQYCSACHGERSEEHTSELQSRGLI